MSVLSILWTLAAEGGRKMKKYLPYIAAIITASIFGFSFLFTKDALDVVSPIHLLAFRFGLAALAMFFLWLFRIIKINYSGKKMGLLLLLAVVQPGLYFIFETAGINLTTSSEAGLMIALIPVVVTIFASIFLREKPVRIQIFFILLSVSGVIFIIFMKGTTSVKNNFLGMFFLGGAVLMAAIYNILSRKLSLNFRPVEITFIMMFSGAVLFNLIALSQLRGNISQYLLPLTDLKVLGSILYLGLLSSIVAFFMMNYTLSRIEAAQSAVFANLTTIISILAGVFVRNEPFYWFQIVGGIMIITGVWGTNYFGLQKKRLQSRYNELSH